MEIFSLAAVSLTIAVSLFIHQKKDPLYRSFAAVCLAVFLHKGGAFLYDIFPLPFWQMIRFLGLVAVAPVMVLFTRYLLGTETFLARRDSVALAAVSAALAVLNLTPLSAWPYLAAAAELYVAAVLAICYAAVLAYLRRKTAGPERKRIGYLAIACAATAVFGTVDLFRHLGYGVPPLSNLLLAALAYFIMIVITHPHLSELHDLMAKALVVALVTLFATITLYIFLSLFGSGAPPPWTHVLVAAFVVVISIEPFKWILKKIFSALYPDSRDVFTSLYEFDEKLEREKALLLEEMAPVLAHEIRNPLGSIKAAAQHMESDAAADEPRRLLRVIIEEVDRLNRVVSQFLDYAKPHSSSQMRLQYVNPIIEKVLSLIEARGAAASVKIEKDLRAELPPVPADAEQLMQVILNIVFNAIEEMPGGGTLSVRTSRIGGEAGEAVGISIRDTGRGIRREDMKHVFKPFFTTKERGVGLGLAICQKIVRRHGGTIRVKSLPGQGTIFYIRLPADGGAA